MIQNERALISKSELYINEVVFYSREDISLLGFIQDGSRFCEAEIIIDRANLQRLLSCNKGRGTEVLWRMENLFVYPHQVPAIIDMIGLFGTTQVFEAGEIRLDPMALEGMQEITVAENEMLVLYVESVIDNNPATREIIF